MKLAPIYSLLRSVLFSGACFSVCMFVSGENHVGSFIYSCMCVHMGTLLRLFVGQPLPFFFETLS